MADQNEKRKFLFFSPYTIFGNHQLRHIMTKTNNWTVQNSPYKPWLVLTFLLHSLTGEETGAEHFILFPNPNSWSSQTLHNFSLIDFDSDDSDSDLGNFYLRIWLYLNLNLNQQIILKFQENHLWHWFLSLNESQMQLLNCSIYLTNRAHD